MDNVELVCVVCKKENRGSDVWRYHDNPSTWEKEDGLCPDCCQELFPEFNPGNKRIVSPVFAIREILSSVFNQFKSLVGSTQ